jgi:hypothetical protein
MPRSACSELELMGTIEPSERSVLLVREQGLETGPCPTQARRGPLEAAGRSQLVLEVPLPGRVDDLDLAARLAGERGVALPFWRRWELVLSGSGTSIPRPVQNRKRRAGIISSSLSSSAGSQESMSRRSGPL